MKPYELLSAQTEYFQESILGNSKIYTQTICMVFDAEKTEDELQDIARTFEKQNDVFRLKFTRDGKQYFTDKKENDKRIDQKKFEYYEVEKENDIWEFAKADVNTRAIDIFDTTISFVIMKAPHVSGFVLTGHHIICDGFSVPLIIEQLTELMGLKEGKGIIAGSYEEHIKAELEYPKTKRFEKDRKYWERIQSDDELSYSLFDGLVNREDCIDNLAGAAINRNQTMSGSVPEREAALSVTSSGQKTVRIEKEKISEIKAKCHEADISVASYFNAIMGIFLSRLTGKKHFTMGIPVLNRMAEDDFTTVGLYLHVVPMVFDADGRNFDEILEDCDDNTMDLFRHQKFTQYDIKKNLNIDHELFDVVVDYQNYYPNAHLRFGVAFPNESSVNLEVHFCEKEDGCVDTIVRYRTALFSEKRIEYYLEGLVKAIDQSTDMLEKCRMKQSKDTYECGEVSDFIDESSAYSNSPKADSCISMFNLFEGFRADGQKMNIPEKSLYEIFDETCRKYPENTAIELCSGERYTYRELRKLAEVIDYELTLSEKPTISETKNAEANEPDTKKEIEVIGVLCDRSAEMYASIYGIIRGGRAYMPISLEWPVERIKSVLTESKCRRVLFADKYLELVKSVSTICPDTIFKSINIYEIQKKDCKAEPIPVKAKSDDLLYVLFTSGSTGNPKGAMISNRSAVNRILWMHEEYGLGDHDTILQKTPFTFDVSVWEILWWAFSGAKLSVMNPEEHFIPERIVTAIKETGVTHLHFVPSVFRIFVKYLDTHPERISELKTLKHIFLSGEQIDAELTNEFFRLIDSLEKGNVLECELNSDSFSKVKIHNLYGPTECTIDVTYYDINREETNPIPIGHPVSNTGIFVVDEFGNRLKRGMVGEIAVSGENVGLGYINNPEMTEKNFIYNDYNDYNDNINYIDYNNYIVAAGKRIYRTGDLGFFDDNSNLLYIGRIDNQVKLNGQRIELKEIEKIAIKTGLAQDAKALVCDENDRQILCLFVKERDNTSEISDDRTIIDNYEEPQKVIGDNTFKIPKERISKTIKESLTDILKESLPIYMVPSVIISLDEMPLNQSGKLDAKKLISIYESEKAQSETLSRELDESQKEIPIDETECEIADCFREILKIDEVYRDTDFLKYKASSLDIVSLLSCSSLFDELTGTDIMVNSTPRKLAACIREKEAQKREEYDGSTSNEVRETREQLITLIHRGERRTSLIHHTTQESNTSSSPDNLHSYEEKNHKERAYVLFPYAGGGAEAYVELVREISKRDRSADIYFVPFISVRNVDAIYYRLNTKTYFNDADNSKSEENLSPEHSVSKQSSERQLKAYPYLFDENKLQSIAESLIELSKEKEIVFYSHCIGSVIALSIMDAVRKKTELGYTGNNEKAKDNGNVEKKVISYYFAAASDPEVNREGENIWRKVPFFFPRKLLKKAGAPIELLDDEVIARFIYDTDMYFDYMKKDHISSLPAFDVPTTIILSDTDIFTKGSRHALKSWSKLCSDIRSVENIKTDTHYFQSKNADKIAEVISYR